MTRLTALWKDPPPALAFELSEAGIAMARAGRNPEFDFRPLDPGVISVSPLREAVERMGHGAGWGKNRHAAQLVASGSVWVLL